MQDTCACDGGDEDDGSATVRVGLLHHVAAAGLGDDEGTREVNIDKSAKLAHVVRFGFDVRATRSGSLCLSVIILLVLFFPFFLPFRSGCKKKSYNEFKQ